MNKRFLIVTGLCMLIFAASFQMARADEPGEPVVYIRLADPAQFPDLQKSGPNGVYLAGFKGVGLMERTSQNPILVTHAYNRDKKQYVKLYLAWNQVVGMQIIDPKLAL